MEIGQIHTREQCSQGNPHSADVQKTKKKKKKKKKLNSISVLVLKDC